MQKSIIFLLACFLTFNSVAQSHQNTTNNSKIYTMVDEMPEFPGGQMELLKYLAKNVRYPKAAKASGAEGRVILQYVIHENGTIHDIKVVRSIHPLLDKEAIRVIKKMPLWKPGKENGKLVKVKYNSPIRFKLTETPKRSKKRKSK